MLQKKYYFIILWILFYPMEAKLSGRVDYIHAENVVSFTPLIVVAKPIDIEPKVYTIKFKDNSSYIWTTQDFEIIKILKNSFTEKNSNSFSFKQSKIDKIISVSTFDGYKFTIAKKYADGIRKIGWYKMYKPINKVPEDPEEDDTQILFLNQANHINPEHNKPNTYVYAIPNAVESIENINLIKKIISKDN